MNLVVPAGQVHELSGPNGCGKSLLLDAAVAAGPATGLCVTLNGTSLDCRSSTVRWQHGLRRMFQSPLIPAKVTVRQALQHAELHGRPASQTSVETQRFLLAASIASDQPIGALSFGQRRAVELCVALQARHAALLDEPFAGIAPALLLAASELIRVAAADGLAVLVVDHMQQVTNLTYAHQHAWAIPSDALSGEPVDTPQMALSNCATDWQRHACEQWILRRLQIGARIVVDSYTIRIAAGELVAVSGGNGAGKSTLLRALAAVDQPWSGIRADIKLPSQPFSWHLSPQPPKLLGDLTVADNLHCMILTGGSNLRDDSRIGCARTLLAWMGLSAGELWSRRGRDLSGGEAAIVALVGAVTCPHPVMLLDEPFEGLSAMALPRAQKLLAYALSMGKSAVITTHDPSLLARIGPASKIALDHPTSTGMLVSGCGYEVLLT